MRWQRERAGKNGNCSGEGGILPEEMQSAYKYIFEYVPNLYSVTDEKPKNADAIEIKIGQGNKTRNGRTSSGRKKVTPEIAGNQKQTAGSGCYKPRPNFQISILEKI